MNFFNILAYLQRAALGIACVVLAACSSGDASVTTPLVENSEQHSKPALQMESTHASQVNIAGSVDNTGHLSVPGWDFLRTLLSLTNGSIGSNLKMPAIWVFSPQGQLAQIVQDGTALETFQAEYSAIDPDVPSMMCQHVEEAISTTIKQAWNMGCADDKWIALLLLPSNCKVSCEKHKSALEQAGQAHQTTLHVKTLLVDLKR